MRKQIVLVSCAVSLLAGCANAPPSAATMAALRTDFDTPKVVADNDCMFSAPKRNAYIADRLNGLCLFSDSQLRLYYGGKTTPLAFAWPIADIKAWALHSDVFTVVTESGNFGLVLKDAAAFVAVLRAHKIQEDDKLPEYRARDTQPSSWM